VLVWVEGAPAAPAAGHLGPVWWIQSEKYAEKYCAYHESWYAQVARAPEHLPKERKIRLCFVGRRSAEAANVAATVVSVEGPHTQEDAVRIIGALIAAEMKVAWGFEYQNNWYCASKERMRNG
jgi:hypothetical protein